MRTKQKTGLAAWKKVYYKQDAKNVSKKNALQHSILKWRGLLKGVLKKFKLHLDGNELLDDGDNSLDIDGSSCALCNHFLHSPGGICGGCPLNKITGFRCDEEYGEFTVMGDVLPMLLLLRKAEKQQIKEQKKCGRSSTRKD